MTRLFKVSLSVVALLLVALMVFTGCGKANEALTTAEEAKKAVVDATAELEAALKNKADAKELSDKVAQLTAAIQAAETVATDGDAALNTAIETAKTTITANVDALLKAHKVDVAGLIAGKADKETVYADIKTLKDMVANIEAATLAKISLEDYVNWNTVIVAYLYEIDTIRGAIEVYADLYEDDWAEIDKAFKLAEVSLYRSFGTNEDTSMADQIFQTLRDTLAKYPNPVDALYYGENGVLAYIAADDKSAAKAQDLYKDILKVYNDSNDGAGNGKELIKSYYVINEDNELESVNLLETSLGLWKTEIQKDVNALAAIFPVYSDSAWFGEGKTDAENLAATRAQLKAFTAGVAGTTVADFTATELSGFVKNENIVAALDNDTTGAVKTATDAAALAYAGDIALTHACVDAIDAWNTACNNWIGTFLTANKPAVLEGENAERYAAVEALIKDTKTALDAKKAALVTAATPYVTDAQGFINAITKFYVSADDKTVDPTKVTLKDGQAIADAWTAAKAWADKYQVTDLDLLFLNPDLDYVSVADKQPAAAISDILSLQDTYNTKFTAAIAAWEALDHETLAKYIAGTETFTIYDTKINAAVKWYTDNGLVVDGEYQNGCTIAKLADATEAYYEDLADLAATLKGLVDAKKIKATELNNALNALSTITLSRKSEIQAAKDLYTAYTADGASKYLEGNAANAGLGIAIDDYAGKISAAETKITAIEGKKTIMDNALAAFAEDANKPATAYPYFGGTAVAQNAYTTLKSNLATAIANFKAENQNNEETYTTAANAKVAEADLLIKLDDALDAEKVVKNNTTKLNALPSYFNADISKATFAANATTLDNAIKAYKGTAGSVAANVAAAEATYAAAQIVLAKENIYEDYLEIYDNAIASVAGVSDANKKATAEANLAELLNNHKAQINAYNMTAEGINETVATDLNNYLLIVKGEVSQAGATYVPSTMI